MKINNTNEINSLIKNALEEKTKINLDEIYLVLFIDSGGMNFLGTFKSLDSYLETFIKSGLEKEHNYGNADISKTILLKSSTLTLGTELFLRETSLGNIQLLKISKDIEKAILLNGCILDLKSDLFSILPQTLTNNTQNMILKLSS